MPFESISIELTKRCNLKCRFCYAAPFGDQKHQELTPDRMCSFLERFQSCGGRRVLFTGGEVFLCVRLFDIITYARSLGLRVDLFSNGTLITARAAELVARHVNLINISIDGPAQLHDRLRGSTGCFQQAVRAAELLHEAGARVSIQTMIVAANLNRVEWLVELAHRTNPRIIRLAHVSRIGRGREQKGLWLTEGQLLRLRGLAMELSERYFQCRTRVTTNLITAHQLRAFYPSFDRVLQPWMMPDGRILTCYVCHAKLYWTFSTAESYPVPVDGAAERRERLCASIYARASQLTCFDFLEVASFVAEEMAKQRCAADRA